MNDGNPIIALAVVVIVITLVEIGISLKKVLHDYLPRITFHRQSHIEHNPFL
jgi:hypothetical protein